MKKLALIGLVSLLVGCQDVVVISEDGTTELTCCDSSFTPTCVCVAKACPDGAFTLKNADRIGGDKVVRCLPPILKGPDK